jgi:hypothetical protein
MIPVLVHGNVINSISRMVDPPMPSRSPRDIYIFRGLRLTLTVGEAIFNLYSDNAVKRESGCEVG